MTALGWIGPTDHAVEALAIFYPQADGFMLIAEVQRGIELEGPTAARLVGRSRFREGSRYVLHRERTGLFALRPDGTVATFLRFYSQAQHELACELWPGGDPVSTDLPRWTRPAPVTETWEVDRDADPGRVYTSAGACQRTGLSREEVARLVLEALEASALLPSEGRTVSGDRQFDGCLLVNGQWLGVVLEDHRIRVVLTHPPPAELARLRTELRAQKAARKAAERKAAGLLQAAALLRENGWTVIPPTEAT